MPTVTRAMTEHDVKVAGDIGEMKGDVRAMKHDIGGLQQSLLLISNQLVELTKQQSKGLGFFAGVVFIITTFGAGLILLAKLVWTGRVG